MRFTPTKFDIIMINYIRIFILLISCSALAMYKSRVFTKQGSFTAEAEGPAVDADQSLENIIFLINSKIIISTFYEI